MMTSPVCTRAEINCWDREADVRSVSSLSWSRPTLDAPPWNRLAATAATPCVKAPPGVEPTQLLRTVPAASPSQPRQALGVQRVWCMW